MSTSANHLVITFGCADPAITSRRKDFSVNQFLKLNTKVRHISLLLSLVSVVTHQTDIRERRIRRIIFVNRFSVFQVTAFAASCLQQSLNLVVHSQRVVFASIPNTREK